MAIQVAIIVGSDSDLPVVSQTAQTLEEFKIPFSVNIASAHRTPEHVRSCVRAAIDAGAKVFIAAAGMSAALPGVVASETTLPVIGVPMAGTNLASLDSLFSVTQMPPGIPVAGVAVGKAGAMNAALLAVQILAVADPSLQKKLQEHRTKMAAAILEKDARLKSTGISAYVDGMKK